VAQKTIAFLLSMALQFGHQPKVAQKITDSISLTEIPFGAQRREVREIEDYISLMAIPSGPQRRVDQKTTECSLPKVAVWAGYRFWLVCWQGCKVFYTDFLKFSFK
jgi:hypothetical protein